MPRKADGLTAAKVRTAKPGRYGDGAGLYLLVRGPVARFWLFRYTRNGKMREMGLGAAAGTSAVSLADARVRARQLYEAVRAGRDPLNDRDAAKAAEAAAAQEAQARAMTFRDVAEVYIAAHEASWRNAAAETGQPSDVAEAALAHTLGNKVQAAYQRGDLLERRRKLMDTWAAFCARPLMDAEIVPLRRAAAEAV